MHIENFNHVPVLLDECIEGLNINPDGIYVDGTLGGAGHSKEIVKRISKSGLLLGIDRDEEAICVAQERLKEFLRRNECYDLDISIGIMQYCMKCKARIAIITMQDILGLDDSARTNLPGTTSKDNWSWKLTDFNNFKVRIKEFK